MDLRGRGRFLRVGHRGASALAPDNTLAGIARAVEAGVDMVEIDVLALRDGTLVLAHSDRLGEVAHGTGRGRIGYRGLEELRVLAPGLATLGEALAFLAAEAPGVLVQLDLKRTGYESEVVAALRRHGVTERALVSSFFGRSLRAIGALEPSLTRALTYPYDRVGVSRSPLPFAPLALAALRRTLAARVGTLLAHADATAASLHQGVVTRRVVERCHAHGAAVLAWTVDDRVTLKRVVAAGVDAVITNDPRIFDGWTND